MGSRRARSFRDRVVLCLVLLLAAGPVGPVLAQSATPVASPAAAVNLTGAQPAPFDAARQAAFDAYVAATLQRLEVPGASVAVTQGGQVVYARGYGVRALGSSEPVTPDTRFMVGSVTKGLTSLLAATVVDDGLATWDTPLADLLPGFRLADPALTERVTLADSFCACTGLPRDDVPVILGAYPTPADLIAGLPEIAVTAPFGERFQYSNQIYAAGGYAATLAAGGSVPTLQSDYALAMQDRVLGPIGMADSSLDLRRVLASGNEAQPTTAGPLGTSQRVPLLADDGFAQSVAPAGALWSTAPDMARYLATEIDGGVAPSGTRVVSAENLARTQAGRTPVPPELAALGVPPALASTSQNYAMGWLTGTWNGLPLVWHGGDTFGFSAKLAMLPEAGLGVAILTNGSRNAQLFNTAVEFRLFELLYGVPPQVEPWLGGILAPREAALAGQTDDLRPLDTTAAAPFVGTYRNPRVGDLRIALAGETLTVSVGRLRSRMQPLANREAGAYALLDGPLSQLSLAYPFLLRTGADGRPEVVVQAVDDDDAPVQFVFARTDDD